jgi:hypothetical protein
MKVECYLRIAKNKRGITIKADNKLVNTPLIRNAGYGKSEALPTVITKLNLTIPDSLFNPVRGIINIELNQEDVQVIDAQVENNEH